MNVYSQPFTHTNLWEVSWTQQFLSANSETKWLAGSRTDALNNVIFLNKKGAPSQEPVYGETVVNQILDILVW